MARFIELAELFEELEKITSPKKLSGKLLIFVGAGRKGSKDSACLFLVSIGPAFESATFGVGDKLALKAIVGAYGILRIRSDKGPYYTTTFRDIRNSKEGIGV